MTSWGEASGSQAGEGSATGSQSGRQGLGDRRVVRQSGVPRQVVRVTDGELGKRGEGYQENGNTELGLENADRTDTNWVVANDELARAGWRSPAEVGSGD